jgi:thiol-disulfide isomerase/thioredoxin
MKKLLFSLSLCLGFLGSNHAQLANGTYCPDFSGTDINGNPHNLYTYLDAGYTVVVDVSATWCPPCWSYHQTGALEDLWMNHGPAGEPGVSASTTNDVIVIYVEGDGSTTLADLQGTGSNTQGDWVTGTDYPIIDDASIASTLGIAYYPTIYTIYPDRYLEESGASQSHYSNISSNVGNHIGGSATVDATIYNYTGDIASCGAINVAVNIQNFGSQPLSGATVEVFDGATSLGSASMSTTLNLYAIEEVTVPVNITSNVNLNIVVTAAGDANSGNDNLSQSVTVESPTIDVDVEIVTDAYGSETTWTLKDATGATVGSGGPYNDLTAVGTTAQTIETVSLTSLSCMTFEVLDSYGDGMNSGYGNGYWTVKDANGGALLSGGTFTSSESGNFKAPASVGLEESVINELSIYPNPFNNNATLSFNVDGMERTSIDLINAIGQTVQSFDLGLVTGAQLVELNAIDLPSGFYLVNIKSGSNTVVTRVTVSK